MHQTIPSLRNEAPSRPYIPELDGLRAVACLLVILFHAAPGALLRGGFLGVDVFFVLSGYLITRSLMAEQDRHGAIAIGRFYLHRAIRLTPALLLFLAAYVMIAPLVWPGHAHWQGAGLAALYLTDYTYPLLGEPLYLRHTWSLAAEEQFYLIWPLLLPLVIRSGRPLLLLGAAWLAITLLRIGLHSQPWDVYYYPLHTRASGLILGAGLALARNLTIDPRWVTVALWAFASLCLTADITASAFVITVSEVLACIVITGIVSGPPILLAKVLTSRIMVGIGKLSYGLYLWHFPIALYVRQDFGFLASAGITFTLALAGSLLSYLTVEAWGRRIRRAL